MIRYIRETYADMQTWELTPRGERVKAILLTARDVVLAFTLVFIGSIS